MPENADNRTSPPPWPLWKKCLAYLLLFLLASVSIWIVDRGAMHINAVNGRW